MITLNDCLRRNDDVPWRIIEEQAIIVNVPAGKVEQANEVAAFIWGQLDGKKKVSEIIESICDNFEVDKERAKKDTLEFLAELFKKNYIKVK